MPTLPAIGAALFVCALLLVFAGRPIPIVIWDEGRIVINAMEMRQSGLSLVTTHHSRPDLWNTKPPLLVWLMTASMALFGPSEWSLRLPSTLASLGTLLLVMAFVRKISGSLATATFAGILLAISVGFFGEHGARTADYDALLCFFTTAYLLILFFAVHRRRPPAPWVLAAAAMGAGALMTKGIAGAIPGAGLLLYLLFSRRRGRLWHGPRYILGGILALLPIAIFYVLRESASPGYLAVSLFNDVGGRFGKVFNPHPPPPLYYVVATFFSGLFSAGPFALLAPLGLVVARGPLRQGLLFALCIAGVELAILSVSATKLSHYYLPAYPFLAIALALAAHALLRSLAQASRLSRLATLGMLALILVRGFAVAIDARQNVLPQREDYPRTRYGALIDTLAVMGHPILVLEGGFPVPDDPAYAPELQYYRMAAGERGVKVAQATDRSAIASTSPGTILATCDDRFAPLLRPIGVELAQIPGCIAVESR